MVLQRSTVTLGFEVRGALVMQGDLTPHTMQPRQPLVAFDRFVAFITFGWAVAFHPVMVHDIRVLFGFHVSLDAGGRGSSHTALVDCVLAEGAGEALLPHANQHVQAEVAVGGLVEVLQSPHMLSIVLHVLHGA